MKNALKTLKNVTYLIIATFVISSCKKDNTIAPAAQTQKITLNFSHTAGDKAINFTDVFTTSAGAKYTLSMFRYYISNIRLVKEDNSEQTITGSYFLVSPNNPTCDLGKIPLGNYKTIKFAVGIDSLTNHSDPTIYPLNNPLAIQSPSMHWNWNSGYIFLMLEGSCDTTVNNTDVLVYGQYSHGLAFHLGMDRLYKKVELIGNFTVDDNTEKRINIKTDINTFLKNVDLKTQNKTHTFSNTPLATLTGNNIPNMFSIIP